ncbi:oxidoreductase, Gfo/Idh/MocA family protein [Listeria fleischmannii FSL S10-1203]|uniref:Oxidoreductase, Gfo/Idh/MocA family protein n=1 Tax=Listeria fleischmannii FSL S10-1203 TaxID=1265822 RepID=W7DKD5_9LIST|nr:oxidoreductase, Gfo/Idh/MocA family protein [Listeria fleischmannii FSL S10-1203]
MERKVKVAVIGIGQMGTYHAEIYQKLPQVELVAICEYNDEKRAEAEQKISMSGL